MRTLLLALAIASAPVRPIPHHSLLEIDARTTGRNYLPTRVGAGYTYYRWSVKGGVMRVDFRAKNGSVLEWRIEPMTGSCDAGKQKSYQVIGNKVWWAQRATEQVAWRCAFDQRGKEVRLVAATELPPDKWSPAGLAIVAASAKRY
jgi:hypothetical protein